MRSFWPGATGETARQGTSRVRGVHAPGGHRCVPLVSLSAMPCVSWFACASLALLQDGEPQPFDLERALATLSAERSAERERAEEWLARHLELSSVPVLARRCAEGGWEERLRLRSALARASIGLEPSVRLARSNEPRAAEIGRGAIVERVARWSAEWTQAPDTRADVLRALDDAIPGWFVLDARASRGRADLALDQLARCAAGAPSLVLDPNVAVGTRAGSADDEPLEGTFDLVLARLARAHDLDLAGFGFRAQDDEGAPRSPRFVLLSADLDAAPLAADGGGAAALLARWCLAVDGDERLALRRASAKALGACGWPDGVRWMARRWASSRASGATDRVWLDGVLTAAARGDVDALLFDRAEHEWLERYVADRSDRELEPRAELWEERALAIARALAVAGRRDLAGGDLLPFAQLPADDPRHDVTTWLRLVVWEGWRDLGERELASLDERIASLDAANSRERAFVLAQALRTRGALRVRLRPLALAHPDLLFGEVRTEAELEALGRTLRASRVSPPAESFALANVRDELAPLARAQIVRWRLAAGDVEGAARDLGTSSSVEATPAQLLALARALRDAARDDGRATLALALERIRAGASAARASALAMALGFTDAADARADGSSELLDVLALARAAGTGRVEARAQLVERLDDVTGLPTTLAGLEWALEAARAENDERSERALVQAVRARLRSAPAAVVARLRPDVWPGVVLPRPIVLSEIDRELPGQRR